MKAGILGYPIEHSLSPKIYGELARECGVELDYGIFSLSEAELERRWSDFEAFDGLNVTSPYKQKVMKFCSSLSPDAERVGAVNVLSKRDGKWIGHNSDVFGFRQSLVETGRDIATAAVFGSGGAARAAIVALEDLGANRIFWVSREPRTLEAKGVVEPCRYTGTFNVDLYVNATPVGMQGHETGSAYEGGFRPGALAYEMIYAPEWTPFRSRARESGCETLGGMAMLVHQAHRAWEIWSPAL
jgi:shikimate dehydrogenase